MAATGKFSKRFLFPEATTFIKYSAHSEKVVLATEEGVIKVYPARLSVLEDPEGEFYESEPIEIELDADTQLKALDISSEYIAYGTSSGKVFLYSLDDGCFEKIAAKFDLDVISLAFTKDGSNVIGGSMDQSIKLVELKERSSISYTANTAVNSPYARKMGTKTLKDHSAAICSIATDPCGQYFASLSTDSSCRIWDGSNIEQPAAVLNLTTIAVIVPTVRDMQWEPAGSLLTLISGRSVMGYARSNWDKSTLIDHYNEILLHRWDASGEYLAFMDDKNDFYIYSPSMRQTVSKVQPMLDYETTITDFNWTPNGKHLGFVDRLGSWYEIEVDFTNMLSSESQTHKTIGAANTSTAFKPQKTGAGIQDKEPNTPLKRLKLVKNSAVKHGLEKLDDLDLGVVPDPFSHPSKHVNPELSTESNAQLKLESLSNARKETSSNKKTNPHPFEDVSSQQKRTKRTQREMQDEFFELEDDLENLKDFIVSEDDEDEDGDDAIVGTDSMDEHTVKGFEHGSSARLARNKAGKTHGHSVALKSVVQPAFQPCITPFDQYARRFLFMNELGYIAARKDDQGQHIEIEFRDVSLGRPLSFLHPESFKIAALCQYGAAFAKGDPKENSSSAGSESSSSLPPSPVEVLHFRHFDSWAANGDWTLTFGKSEHVRCLAITNNFLCVCTSKSRLRVFTLSGIERAVICLDGLPISSSTYKNDVSVYLQTPSSLYSPAISVQCTTFRLAELNATYASDSFRACSMTESVPVSQKATLVWVGNSEIGQKVVLDSSGTLLVQTLIGNILVWTPALDLKRKEASDHLRYWIYGIAQNKALAVYFKNAAFPSVLPRPGLCSLDFEAPFVAVAAGLSAGSASVVSSFPETDVVLKNETSIFSHQLNFTYNVKHAKDVNPSFAETDVQVKLIARNDVSIIKLVHEHIKQDRYMKAVDYARGLKLIKSFNMILDLAHKARSPALVERFSILMEVRNEEIRMESLKGPEALNSKCLAVEENPAFKALAATLQQTQNENRSLVSHFEKLQDELSSMKCTLASLLEKGGLPESASVQTVGSSGHERNDFGRAAVEATTPLKPASFSSNNGNPFRARQSPNVKLVKSDNFTSSTLNS